MQSKANYRTFILPLILVSLAGLITACGSGQKPAPAEPGPDASLKKGVILVDYREQRKVDVYIDGDIFTSYIYPADLEKPVLFPVRTANGTIVTRGYPLDPREGDRADHPHHAGVWFNFGDVNGFDFWGNSSVVPEDRRAHMGRILHRGVKRAESREDLGILEIAADWQVPSKDGEWHTVLQENTILEFSGDENTRTIDRVTQLTAQEDEVQLKDNKEGLYAIRVARQLEHPTDEPGTFIDSKGNPMSTKKLDNEGVNGNYLNSEGIEGTDVWGKRARWVSLSSNIGEEDISIAMFDHPDNFGHPSHWHARGYGLFAVNNLGAAVFDKSAEPVFVKLTPGESMILKHRIHIISGTHAGIDQLEAAFNDFTKK